MSLPSASATNSLTSASKTNAQEGPAAAQRRWTAMRLLGFVSVTLFVASEVVAATGAGVWALSGLLGLGLTGTEVLAALFGVPALYVIFECAQLALIAETDPAND